ncbi:hypothetical protein PanWU01x14_042490 [Parasponia andersonii]|uniref:Uncharacterized protein n=1 Tax=Parasponia andersonii TaxID=3476 RepID=A0A2P5DQQ5_PARAD|nr:hypothetical protein PanWU01x14_042490 [Parasponia andersonii]
MRKGGSTLSYLGVSLFVGTPKQSSFQLILDKINANLEYWRGLSLSMVGRVSLINSVIMGQLVYSFQVCKWPANLLRKLTSSIRNFLWSGSSKMSKLVTVS